MSKNAKARAAIPGSATFSAKSNGADRNRSSLGNQPAFVAEGANVTRGSECGAFALGTAPRVRCCLGCGETGVAGLCTACTVERIFHRLAESIAERAERIAEAEGPSAPQLPVREHLRPKPGRRCSRREFDVALIMDRRPERGSDGWWWQPSSTCPALDVEAMRTEGNA